VANVSLEAVDGFAPTIVVVAGAPPAACVVAPLGVTAPPAGAGVTVPPLGAPGTTGVGSAAEPHGGRI
jgi:hypothetical protein